MLGSDLGLVGIPDEEAIDGIGLAAWANDGIVGSGGRESRDGTLGCAKA
jgi:hypothetical protein